MESQNIWLSTERSLQSPMTVLKKRSYVFIFGCIGNITLPMYTCIVFVKVYDNILSDLINEFHNELYIDYTDRTLSAGS